MLALEGARILTVPAAFTVPTTRDHWEVLLRARAIENQCFVIAANQIGEHVPGLASGGRSMIVDPWGLVLAGAPDDADRDHRRPRLHAAGRDPQPHPVARRAPARGLRAPSGGALTMATRNAQQAAEKRRLILDAAVRVFARQGFHTCRVSDIADEAGVAYGLVYHYFRSKDEVLDTLFLERWNVLLEAIREVDARDAAARDKLYAIASFIVDSYRHDPELMKVIIVEVTRAANSFGRSHLDKIREAYDLIADIVEKAQASGEFKDAVTPAFAAMAFYGAIEQVLTGWIFDVLPESPARLRPGQDLRRRDDLRRPRAPRTA